MVLLGAAGAIYTEKAEVFIQGYLSNVWPIVKSATSLPNWWVKNGSSQRLRSEHN